MNNYITFVKCATHLNKASSDNLDQRQKSLETLYDLFIREKGLYLKLGQFLNQYKEDVDYSNKTINTFESLSDDLKRSIRFKLTRLKLEMISEEVNLGSIGVVIKCKDINNQHLALKVKYPEIESNLKSQFKALSNITTIAPKKVRESLRNSNFLYEIEKNICEEINYNNEVSNYQLMHSGNINNYVSFPKIMNSGKDYILMTWQNGSTLGTKALLTDREKDYISQNLLKNYFHYLFNEGIVQVDNQEDNYLYDKKSALISAVDLGNCTKISYNARLSLLRIIRGLQNKEDINYIQLLSTLGFSKEKLEHINLTITPLLEAIFFPFVSKTKYDLNNYKLNEMIDTILGEKKWCFRMAGNSDVFSLMRSFSLLIKTLKKLNRPIYFKGILDQELNSELESELKSLHLNSEHNHDFFKSQAYSLIIEVKENGKQKILLTFPPTILKNIEEYIDNEIKEKIAQRNIDIKSIIEKAYKRGLRPQTIINLNYDSKEIHIKLS
jgi:predicted unusual protein kinase regulating ubiquinone biosynthesis (AarF/ABC1/UbiB family)